MAKYGTFMKTEDFGSKFFCGKKLTPFPEPPLHYMQGKTMVHCNWTVKGMLNMIVQVRVVLNRVTCNQAYIFSEYAGRRLSLGLLLMKVPGRFSGNRALSSLKARIRGSEFFLFFSHCKGQRATSRHRLGEVRTKIRAQPYQSCLTIPLSSPSYPHCF